MIWLRVHSLWLIFLSLCSRLIDWWIDRITSSLGLAWSIAGGCVLPTNNIPTRILFRSCVTSYTCTDVTEVVMGCIYLMDVFIWWMYLFDWILPYYCSLNTQVGGIYYITLTEVTMVYAVWARSLSSYIKVRGGCVSSLGTICRWHLTLNTEKSLE